MVKEDYGRGYNSYALPRFDDIPAIHGHCGHIVQICQNTKSEHEIAVHVFYLRTNWFVTQLFAHI
jgi:hypothetical protein